MNYDQIDVLDTGTVWQGGAVDAAIDSPPFDRVQARLARLTRFRQ